MECAYECEVEGEHSRSEGCEALSSGAVGWEDCLCDGYLCFTGFSSEEENGLHGVSSTGKLHDAFDEFFWHLELHGSIYVSLLNKVVGMVVLSVNMCSFAGELMHIGIGFKAF